MMEVPVRLSDFSDILQRDRLLRSEGDCQNISLSSTSRELFNETKKSIPRANQLKLKDLISPSVSRYNSSKYSLRARSHSPIGSPPSSKRSVENTLLRCDFTAAHSEEELMQTLDASKIEEINSNIDSHCHLIDQSDEASMQKLLCDAQKDLSILGFCYSQLWLLEPGGGLSFKTTNDGTRVNISPQKTIGLFNKIGIQASSTRNRYNTVTVLTPADPLWEECLSYILESDSTSEITSSTDRKNQQRKAIHLIPILSSTSIRGIIFATEIETFASATVARRISSINTSKIRVVLATQWYKQLAKVIGLRLNALHEEKIRIATIETKDEDVVRTETAEGLLKLNEELSEMTDICAISNSIVSAGVTLFKGSICFILNPHLQKNNSNERGSIIDANYVTVFTADSNSAITPISPIKVNNRGLITTLISNHDSYFDGCQDLGVAKENVLRNKCINGKFEQMSDSVKHFDSGNNDNTNDSSSSSNSSGIKSCIKIERKLTTLEVSKDELIDAGLCVREDSENFSIICLSIPFKKMDDGLHDSNSMNKNDLFCSFVLAFPCVSSCVASAPDTTADLNNDQMNSRSIHQKERIKIQLNVLMKIASYAFFRIEKLSPKTIEKYENRNTDMTRIISTSRDSLAVSKDLVLKERKMQMDLRACMLCTSNLAVFSSRAAEVSTLKDLGTIMIYYDIHILFY
jgi:hypothetical protein